MFGDGETDREERVRELLAGLPCLQARRGWDVVTRPVLPSTVDVAFFYELLAATRSNKVGVPSAPAGNFYPRPIDFRRGRDEENWWRWWHVADAAEVADGMPENWAKPLSSIQAGYLSLCARIPSGILASLAFGQWKLSGETAYPSDWFRVRYGLPERFADRMRMNFDVTDVVYRAGLPDSTIDPVGAADSEAPLGGAIAREPAHPVLTFWQGRLGAESVYAGRGKSHARVPPRQTRFAVLAAENPFRRLRTGMVGKSALGTLLGLPDVPDSLVCPLRWSTAMHTSFGDGIPSLGLDANSRRDLHAQGVKFTTGPFDLDGLGGLCQVMAAPRSLDRARDLAIRTSGVEKALEKLADKRRPTAKDAEKVRDLRDELVALNEEYRAQFEGAGLDLRQLAVLGLDARNLLNPLEGLITSFGDLFFPSRRVLPSLSLALLGLTRDEAAGIQQVLGGIDGTEVPPTPEIGAAADEPWIHLGPRFSARASQCVRAVGSDPSTEAFPDFQVLHELPNDRFRPPGLMVGRDPDDSVLAVLRAYADDGRPTENLMRIFDDTAALVEMTLQCDEALLACNDFIAGTGLIVEVLRGAVLELGVSWAFDVLDGVAPGQAVRFLIRQLLTDLYLGWVGARYSEAAVACLYPFIPWMETEALRAQTDAALGPADPVALGALQEIDLSIVNFAWQDAQERFKSDLKGLVSVEFEFKDEWATRVDSLSDDLSTVLVRRGLVSLVAGGPSTGAAIEALPNIFQTSRTTPFDPSPIAVLRAWLGSARRVGFPDEG